MGMSRVGDGISRVTMMNGVYRITIEKSVAEDLGLKVGDNVHYMVQKLELNDEITRMKAALRGPDEKR